MALVLIVTLLGLCIGALMPAFINRFHKNLITFKIPNDYKSKLLCAIVTATAYFLVISRFGLCYPALAGLIFATGIIMLSIIDFNEYLLPDAITIPLTGLGILVNYFGMFTIFENSLIGAVIGYASLYAVYLLYKAIRKKEGLGFGDFWLFAVIGAWFGPDALLPALMIAAVTGSVVGITLMYITKKGSDLAIAFGPYLALGGFVMLLYKDALMEFYIYLFGF